jgi:Ni/Co efflux regulator RcnB
VKSRRAGDFETARAWQRIAEIAHYEQLMATEKGSAFENGTEAPPKWRRWLINTSRDLRLRHLLTHRARQNFRPFGVELDLTRAIDWILGHENAHMHM